jgi:hypothetical protein
VEIAVGGMHFNAIKASEGALTLPWAWASTTPGSSELSARGIAVAALWWLPSALDHAHSAWAGTLRGDWGRAGGCSNGWRCVCQSWRRKYARPRHAQPESLAANQQFAHRWMPGDSRA